MGFVAGCICAPFLSQIHQPTKIGAERGEGVNPILTMPKFWECFNQQPLIRKRSKTPANDNAPDAKSREEEKSEEKEAALRVVEERSRRLGMRGRLSWTYGGSREKQGGEAEEAGSRENEAEKPERVVLRASLVERRELQRGASFPGRLGGGGGQLSKEEAKRRLLSWRRTTIVRKTSEQNRWAT